LIEDSGRNPWAARDLTHNVASCDEIGSAGTGVPAGSRVLEHERIRRRRVG
jgi:hypothetical protein